MRDERAAFGRLFCLVRPTAGAAAHKRSLPPTLRGANYRPIPTESCQRQTLVAHSVRSIPELLQQALQALEASAFDKAEDLCRLVLKSHPKQTVALHLFAIIALESGRFTEADQRFRSLLAIKPHTQQVLLNHSIALCELGRHAEAVAQCDRALALGGDRARAYAMRASALRLGKRSAEALASYDQALALAPRNGEIHFNRGNVLRDLERFAEAVASYEAALAITPRHLGAVNNRGSALRELGRYEEALASYDRVLAIDPGTWQAYNNRGNLLHATGRLETAVGAFERAIALAPGNPECRYNLGNVLQDLGRHGEAMRAYSEVLSIEPSHGEALVNRAGAARRLKLYRQAIADYTAAKREHPSFPYLDGYLAHTRALCCDWSRPDQDTALIEAVRRGERACEPFGLFSLCDNEADLQTCATQWAEQKVGRLEVLAQPATRRHGPITVAYLSPDFRNHAVSSVLARLIEVHDRRQFRILGIAFGPKANDDMSRRLAAAFDAVIDVRGVSDAKAAEMLRAEGVDIAVDLAGYTEHPRTGILARRPAPVQVNYLGQPGTMGAAFIDYLIADQRVLPQASRAFYAEKIVYLPDTYQVNDDWAPVAATLSRSDARLPANGFVFCCFNNTYKIRPHVFDVWMRLLQRTADSVLWLVDDGPDCIDNLRREAEQRKVAGERLIFAPRVARSAYLAQYKLAGLFLDTLPYNGHATTSDALRAGLPVVTCAGSSFAGRVAGSLLNAVGLPELVARRLEDYEELAFKLATEPAQLARIRATLGANLATQALFDSDRFRRNIEAAYLEMHRRQQAGEPAADFAVDLPS